MVIAGCGLVGLTAASDLAQHGVRVAVLDDDDTVSTGSRASCFAKRTAEICFRLGLGAHFLEKGVIWNQGRVFHGEREAYSFDLLPEAGHEYPVLANLQQNYAEAWLTDAHRDLPPDESRKLNAKLVLLLANHIGELAPVLQAIALAKPPARA